MLKNQFFYFSIIVFFSVFFSCTQNILASDLQGISNLKFEQRTWKSGNVGFHISGTLTGAASDDYHNNTFTKVQIRYVYDPDSKNVDLNTTDYKAGTRISQDDGNDSSFPVQKYAYTEYETVCVVNENKVEKGQSGYDNFYCESLDRNLIPGVYEFQIGGSGITTWNSYINNSYFKIEGVADTDTKPISFSFGSLSAVTAHQMDAKTTGGGWDFSITVQIGDVARAYPMYLELGAATQIGSTAKYDCTPLSQYVSAKQTIGPFTGSKSFGFPFTSIPDNNYCISLKIDFGISVGSISIPIVATGGQSIDKNGFLIDKGSIIHIGNAVPLDPNATNDPEANDLGCKYEKDNKSYCLLAPLPGVGDTTGKLDVTKGMGDYFNMIIKIVMGIIGVLAVLMVIVGGIEYMSTVNIGEKEGALARIGSALLGLLLALSAYLILKAVNPDLVNVNIGVPEGTVEAGGDEGPEETTVAPTANPDVSGVKVESGPARDLALKILQNSKITFNGGKNEARATPKQNIVDISKGENAWTSSRGHKGAVQTSIDSRLLAGILAAANVSPIQINEIAGGRHSGPSSAHYTGHAVDIQSSPNDTARAKQIMNACLAAGARKGQIFGPCNNKYLPDHEFSACDATGGYLTNADHQTHIHCTW